ISHLISAGSVLKAAGIIQESYTFFPKGTVHMAVVDPGVGSERRLILLETEEYFFVGPDNGIFWPIIVTHPDIKVIHLTESKYFLPNITHTFHGRDIFAPVAAHLSRGVDPRKMGHPVSDPVPLKVPRPQQKGEVLSGQVIRVDHFGNLITNILQKNLDRFSGSARPVIKIGEMVVEGVSKTYADASAGETLAMIGSSGLLEIAVNLGRACDRLGLNSEDIVGTKIEVARGI
ncbi:MAG: SAM-dependent chlorinase/fluorinase, partial [Deltaproteobacteria bacterium]|nr:SAM-dependent chlorinase/fluorinase [Deltaproteobacteria bacterium]